MAIESTRKFIVATRNRHKLDEFAEILSGYELIELPAHVELPPEDGESFAENAIIKAEAAHSATGRPSIADDSGIVAYALDGRPGIYSARYAGENASDGENLAKLIAELEGETDRRVAYVCVVAVAGLEDDVLTFEGRCEGVLIDSPRGSGGFGYDPAFLPDATGPVDRRTMAELSPDEKHAISHRGQAARLFARYLAGRG